MHWHLCVFLTGTSENSILEIPPLVCTCVMATLLWILLTLFIRKLKQVRGIFFIYFFVVVLFSSNCIPPLLWIDITKLMVITQVSLLSRVNFLFKAFHFDSEHSKITQSVYVQPTEGREYREFTQVLLKREHVGPLLALRGCYIN